MEKLGSHVTPKRRPAKASPGYAPPPEAEPPQAGFEPSVQQPAPSDAGAGAMEAASLHIQKSVQEKRAQIHRRVKDAVQVGPRFFSDREQKILRLIGEGKTDGSIASELVISERTAKQYVQALLAKIGAENRTQAAIFAINHSPTTMPSANTGSEADYAAWVAREAARHTETALARFSPRHNFSETETERLLEWCTLLISNEAAFWEVVPGGGFNGLSKVHMALMLDLIPKLSKRHLIALRQLEDPRCHHARITYGLGETLTVAIIIDRPVFQYIQWDNELKYFPIPGIDLSIDSRNEKYYVNITDADLSGTTMDSHEKKQATTEASGQHYSAAQFEIIARRDSTLFARHERYDETREAYVNDPSDDNARAVRSAIQSLRLKQKQLGFDREPMDPIASMAISQLRPSTAKPLPPGRPRPGRPRASTPAAT